MQKLHTSASARTEARGDLAQHLRLLLARADLTPRQLAAEHDLPYRMGKLYRFFSGELLPPPLLINVVARHCLNPQELHGVYDRACRADAAAAENAGKYARKEQLRRTALQLFRTVPMLGLVTGVVVAMAVIGGVSRWTPSDGPPHQSPPPAVPESPAPGPDRQVPSSHRETSAKQKPEDAGADRSRSRYLRAQRPERSSQWGGQGRGRGFRGR